MNLGPYAKTIVAALVAGLTALSTLMTDGVSASDWVVIALAVLGALGVYTVPNKPRD